MTALAQQPGESIPSSDALYDRLQQAVLDEHRHDLASGNPYFIYERIWHWAPAVRTVPGREQGNRLHSP